METLSSALDPSSDEFKANAEQNRPLVLVRQGKLFVRERVKRLLDPGASGTVNDIGYVSKQEMT